MYASSMGAQGSSLGAQAAAADSVFFEDGFTSVTPDMWSSGLTSANVNSFLNPAFEFEDIKAEDSNGSPSVALSSPESVGSVDTHADAATRSDGKTASDTSGENSEDSSEEVSSTPASVPLFSSFRLGGNTKAKTPEETSPSGDKFQRHNQSEKKRRDNMNDYIGVLHSMVPALHTLHKPSKGMILSKSIEYIKRMQQKTSKLETQVGDLMNELKQQRRYTELLSVVLSEHGIAIPPLAVAGIEMPTSQHSFSGTNVPLHQTPQYHRTAGYYVQDAGRVAVLFGALVFFALAPWHFPTWSSAASAAAEGTAGRSLLSVPMAAFELEGWWAFTASFIFRFIVMSGLLMVAMFSDTFYCNDEIKKKLPLVAQLNTLADECMENGNYIKAAEHTDEALAILNRPVPNSSFDLLFGNMYQGARQIAHRCVTGLVFDRFLFFSSGQMEYVQELRRCYLNKAMQSHCLPSYNKWADLYTILCSVNFAEVFDGDIGDSLVRSYSALCYHVCVHSKAFEIFGSIYMSLAFRAMNRLGLNQSQFGQFYIVVAYRHLLNGHFQQVFDNLQRGMEMHRMFGQNHQLRECLNARGWIELTIGLQQSSAESFRQLYDLADVDLDNYGKMWALLGTAANLAQEGRHDQASEYLDRAAAVEDVTNAHQLMFALGFRAHINLREGYEEGALDVAERTISKLKAPTAAAAPHNVLPLHKLLDVHLTLLEQYQGNDSPHAKAVIKRCVEGINEELTLYRQFIVRIPLMRCGLHICEGRFAALYQNQNERAEALLKRAVHMSREANLKPMEGAACFELGRILPEGSADRKMYLEAAAAIFKAVQAKYDEQLAIAELASKGASRIFKMRAEDV